MRTGPFWLIGCALVIGASLVAIAGSYALPDVAGFSFHELLLPQAAVPFQLDHALIILLTSNAAAAAIVWLFRKGLRRSLRQQLLEIGKRVCASRGVPERTDHPC
jgi:hypothetical protein